MTTVKDSELLEATRHLLDLKKEKKDYNKDMNEQIKAAEETIKRLAKDDTEKLL
jgi:hypothetical protein